MSFESTVLGLLRDNEKLTSIIPADRMFFGKVPQGTGAPFLGCFRITTEPSLTTDNGEDGSSELDNIKLQITVYAVTEPRCHDAAKWVRRCLESAPSEVCDCYLEDQAQTFDDTTELQGQILRFSCWFPDTVSLE
jgi:hypothetical protein